MAILDQPNSDNPAFYDLSFMYTKRCNLQCSFWRRGSGFPIFPPTLAARSTSTSSRWMTEPNGAPARGSGSRRKSSKPRRHRGTERMLNSEL